MWAARRRKGIGGEDNIFSFYMAGIFGPSIVARPDNTVLAIATAKNDNMAIPPQNGDVICNFNITGFGWQGDRGVYEDFDPADGERVNDFVSIGTDGASNVFASWADKGDGATGYSDRDQFYDRFSGSSWDAGIEANMLYDYPDNSKAGHYTDVERHAPLTANDIGILFSEYNADDCINFTTLSCTPNPNAPNIFMTEPDDVDDVAFNSYDIRWIDEDPIYITMLMIISAMVPC